MKQSNERQGLVSLLTSDSFQLLCLLDSLQTETLEGLRVRESQEEIAELFHVSKGKLNPLMQSLVASGCIQKYRARSGYTVTALGTQVIAHIGQLEGIERRLKQLTGKAG
jgi:DNA-binding PadR family transcriptional regulator